MRKTLTVIFSTSCRPCSHVTETQGFVQQKKTERQAKTSKKVKLYSNKTVSSR